MIIGVVTLIPMIMVAFYPSELNFMWAFLVTGLCSGVIGFLLWFLFIRKRLTNPLSHNQDAVLIVCIWIIAVLVSAIPWATSGIPGMHYGNAIFEMTSGFTTTGATTLDADSTAKIFLLHRTIIQAIGGIGLILVISTAFLKSSGMKLYSAEGHGEMIIPNLAKTARTIVLFYLGFITIGTIAFLFTGMNFFESFGFAVSCISTGGFSVVTGNIAHYNNIAVELIAMTLMLIGGLNFYIHLFIIKGKFKKIVFDRETTVFVITCLLLPLMVGLLLTPQIATIDPLLPVNNYGDALRYSSFMVISATTTTGLQNVSDIAAFPQGLLAILSFLCILGGSSGSTAGGIKTFRVIVIVKGMFYNLTERFGNKRIVTSHFIKRYGEDEEITPRLFTSSVSYAVLYVSVILFGTLVFSIANGDAAGYGGFGQSFFEAASLTSSMGLTVAGYSFTDNIWIAMCATLLMFLGRLEIVPVFNAITRGSKDAIHFVQDQRRKKRASRLSDFNPQ